MAKYEHITVDGMNYREYAMMLVNNGTEDAEWDLVSEFKMSERQALDVLKWTRNNTGGYRDETERQIENKRIASLPWQDRPASSKQMNYINSLAESVGVDVPDNLTQIQASKIIDALKDKKSQQAKKQADEFVANLVK